MHASYAAAVQAAEYNQDLIQGLVAMFHSEYLLLAHQMIFKQWHLFFAVQSEQGVVQYQFDNEYYNIIAFLKTSHTILEHWVNFDTLQEVEPKWGWLAFIVWPTEGSASMGIYEVNFDPMQEIRTKIDWHSYEIT